MPLPTVPLEAIRQPALLHDAGGRVVAANDRAELLAGRPLAGATIAEVQALFRLRSPDGTTCPPARLPVARALRGEEVVDLPATVTAADGRRLHVLITASPVSGGGALVVWHDVTASEELRERIAESEARHRNLVELSPDAILIHQDGLIVFANPAAVELAGAAGPEALVGRPVLDLVAQGGRGDVERSIFADLAGRESPRVTVDLVRPDGRTVIVQGRGAAIPFGGRPAVQVVLRDVTEERRVGDALRRSEERLRLALESAEIGIWDRNAVTGRVTISPEYLGRYGLGAEAATRYEDWARLIHPDNVGRVEALRRRTLAGGEPLDLEFRVVLPWDRLIWVQFKGRAVPDEAGGLSRVIGVLIDVTARKQADLALARYAGDLRTSQDQLRDVIAATGAGYFHLSLHDARGSLSTRGAAILGFSTTEMPSLLEIAVEAQARMHPDDIDRVLGAFMAFVEADIERTDQEFRVRTPEGGWRWVQAIGTSAERDANGRVVTLAGFLFDIDERKRSEEALRRSNMELQRFAYVASHDLQEPLRSIISFSQLLEMRYRGKLGKDADEYIAFIVEGGNRMQALIRDLLTFSRVETAAKPLALTETRAVVADAVRSMDAALRDAEAIVEVGELPRAMADAAQLEQVFANLISNALKYRREGVPPVVRISARREGPMVEFAVQDNGIGIEAEYFDRIFEMFQRLHTHDQYEGTGIGLAVVKRIVERHGGRVRVTSVPGEGSTISFTLPAA